LIFFIAVSSHAFVGTVAAPVAGGQWISTARPTFQDRREHSTDHARTTRNDSGLGALDGPEAHLGTSWAIPVREMLTSRRPGLDVGDTCGNLIHIAQRH
jgi:hypothetical protein